MNKQPYNSREETPLNRLVHTRQFRVTRMHAIEDDCWSFLPEPVKSELLGGFGRAKEELKCLDKNRGAGHYCRMTIPKQLDVEIKCNCGSRMYIASRELAENHFVMVHTFHCDKCGADRQFQFPKVKRITPEGAI